MAGIGLTHDQIAKIMAISDETLRKYYPNELETGLSRMNAMVAQNLFFYRNVKKAKAPLLPHASGSKRALAGMRCPAPNTPAQTADQCKLLLKPSMLLNSMPKNAMLSAKL